MIPQKCYRIRRWNEIYECSQSRRVRTVSWIAKPIKHDGKGYRRVAKQDNRVELWCAWCLIQDIAGRMPVRGLLADYDGPLSAEDMADSTGYPVHIFENALQFFVRPEIAWLEECDYSECAHSTVTERYEQPNRTEPNRQDDTEPDRTGQDNIVSGDASHPVSSVSVSDEEWAQETERCLNRLLLKCPDRIDPKGTASFLHQFRWLAATADRDQGREMFLRDVASVVARKGNRNTLAMIQSKLNHWLQANGLGKGAGNGDQ